MTNPANDAQLSQDVRSRLGRDRGSGESRINVSSCSFVVTLHGTVGSLEEAGRILDLVKTVDGVAAVDVLPFPKSHALVKVPSAVDVFTKLTVAPGQERVSGLKKSGTGSVAVITFDNVRLSTQPAASKTFN